MTKYDVIIVGSGPAAITAGVTIRTQHPDKQVAIFGENQTTMVPCGIPYIFHKLDSIDKNIMHPTPFQNAGGIIITRKITDIDVSNKTIKDMNGDIYGYDKLILATGSKVIEPKFIQGYNLENVFYVKKNYEYMKIVLDKIHNKKNIIVLGGGFIGAEVAEQLAQNPGQKVTLIEGEEYCFAKAFSNELSKIATEQLVKANVNVLTSTKLNEIVGENGIVSGVKLDSGKILEADAVILAIGYKPNVELAQKIGLRLNVAGAIVVDNYYRTDIDDIYAIGDCSQTLGYLTGRTDYIMLASTATAEARVLGHNLFGIKIKDSFTGTIGIFSTEVSGLAMAAAGLNEKSAEVANIEFITSEFKSVDRHPGTFPDAQPLNVKLFVSPYDGSIFGGEVWGGKSAGEIINTIGLAIQKGMTVYEMISYQIGTQPLLTGPPTMPVFIKAAEAAITKLRNRTK